MKQKNKVLKILGFVGIRLVIITLLTVCFMIFINHPGINYKAKASTVKKLDDYKFIAHRGYFGSGCAENTLEAFARAVENRVSIELDVHLTVDNKLMVFHDDTMGKNAIKIPETVTANQDRVIQDKLLVTPIKDLKRYDILRVCNNFLLYGCNTVVPELREVIDEVKTKQKPKQKTLILVEIKANVKDSNDYINRLCQAVADTIKEKSHIESIDFAVQSFHPSVIRWFKKNAPHIMRGFLSKNFMSNHKDGEPKGMVGFLLANNYFNFLIRPDFVAYEAVNKSKLPIGQKTMNNYHSYRFAWTIKNVEDYKYAKSLGFTHFIFDTVSVDDLRNN